MRVLKVELPGKLTWSEAALSQSFDTIITQLYQELDGLKLALAETARARIAAYLPTDHSVFVRLDLEPENNVSRYSIWIDVPYMRWPASLFARRAWELSIPVLAHATCQAFKETVQDVELQIDVKRARIAAYAPARIWNDSAVIALIVAAACTASWLYAGPIVVAKLRAILYL